MLSRYKKFGSFVFLIMLILAGCSDIKQNSAASDNESSSQDNDFQKFKTEDGEIEINIFNKGSFSEATLKQIKEETLSFYTALKKENVLLSSPSKIYLHLYDEKKVSYASDNTIHLYWVKEGNYPLIHELTHVILGYTEGHVTQEGLAIFMQDSYSDRGAFPNFHEDVHGIMKYLMTRGISISLETLLREEKIFTQSNLNKDSYSLRWLGYIESASFSDFLINQYGMEKFLKIYDRPNLTDEIHAVYGKKLEHFEMEWKEFLQRKSIPNEETIRSYEPQIQEIINHLEANKEQLLKTS
ncbi:hypothetical protein [Cytobacillus firmus]|uniref:hypothetical protein n=1 Tax=Cytobacillus firmus TaxID=1399 RepID=UPI00202E6408|nr:hypothetical protein [Cytobacillus firmus]URT71610.1 hypothetical protein NAF01_03850 [Cytobacillus firmus]